MRKFINILILVVALVGSVSAQSLDDLRKKAYDASIEAVNKGKNRKSAYEEYLEKQELEAAKKAEEEALEAKEVEESNFEENCELLKASAIDYPLEKEVWIKCYCYPCEGYVWYNLFIGNDDNLWINIRYDYNGEVGDIFYAAVIKRLDYTKAIDDMSEKVSAAIKLTSTDDRYTIIVQDFHDPKDFAITWFF